MKKADEKNASLSIIIYISHRTFLSESRIVGTYPPFERTLILTQFWLLGACQDEVHQPLTLLLPSWKKKNSPNLLKEKCIGEVVRISSIIIFHLSKLWGANFFTLFDVLFLARLQEKFGINHSWEWKGYVIWHLFPNKLHRDFRSTSQWAPLSQPVQQISPRSVLRDTPDIFCFLPHSDYTKNLGLPFGPGKPLIYLSNQCCPLRLTNHKSQLISWTSLLGRRWKGPHPLCTIRRDCEVHKGTPWAIPLEPWS